MNSGERSRSDIRRSSRARSASTISVAEESMRIRYRSLARSDDPRDHQLMDLDPVHLRSLQAIVRYGGYHRAAEALHLTQPAISRHIRRLEEQLGEPLFVKRGRGVELTPFGERAAAELGEVVAVHDQALA